MLGAGVFFAFEPFAAAALLVVLFVGVLFDAVVFEAAPRLEELGFDRPPPDERRPRRTGATDILDARERGFFGFFSAM
jgi:hypothetical protein